MSFVITNLGLDQEPDPDKIRTQQQPGPDTDSARYLDPDPGPDFLIMYPKHWIKYPTLARIV